MMLLWINSFWADLVKSGANQGCHPEFHRANWKRIMAWQNDVSGVAALSICESLLLALNDRKILPEKEILGILADAAAGHENAPNDDGKAEFHQAVAQLINAILNGGNSVRRS
jgi:hypothetical protein